MGWVVKVLFCCLFVSGSALFWYFVLSNIRMTRNDRFSRWFEKASVIEKGRRKEKSENKVVSKKEREFSEKARFAGLPLYVTYSLFENARAGLSLFFMIITFLLSFRLLEVLQSMFIVLFFRLTLATFLGWMLPIIIVRYMAKRRKTRMLIEISRFSHRLSVCVTDKSDVRDVIIRASRTMKLLKPSLDDLVAYWGKDQRMAITRFKDSVGISEIFPLVNALQALGQAASDDIAEILEKHTKSIDAALASDVNRKLENAPVFISFYIMIPFMVVLVLFIYPWVITVSQQLTKSFSN